MIIKCHDVSIQPIGFWNAKHSDPDSHQMHLMTVIRILEKGVRISSFFLSSGSHWIEQSSNGPPASGSDRAVIGQSLSSDRVVIRQSSSSHWAVIKQSSVSQWAVIRQSSTLTRQSSGNHQVVIRQSSGSHQAVIRQSSDFCQPFVKQSSGSY